VFDPSLSAQGERLTRFAIPHSRVGMAELIRRVMFASHSIRPFELDPNNPKEREAHKPVFQIPCADL